MRTPAPPFTVHAQDMPPGVPDPPHPRCTLLRNMLRPCSRLLRVERLALPLVAALALVSSPCAAQPHAVVRGTVFDSIAGQPLNRAEITLAERSNPLRTWSATTDVSGSFQFNAVAHGRYIVGFTHPALDSLGIEVPDRSLTVADAPSYDIVLAIPSARTLVASLCSSDLATDSTGLLIGRVLHPGLPLVQEGGVLASWSELQFTKQGINLTTPSASAEAGPGGWFAMCGLPINTPIVVRGWIGADSTGLLELDLPDDGLLRRDLFVGDQRATTTVPAERLVADDTTSPFRRSTAAAGVPRGDGRVTGVIRSLNGIALAGSQIEILGTGLQISTDDAGAFAIDSVPPGSHSLVARRLGFVPYRAVIDVLPPRTTVHDITLAPFLARLDTVRVLTPRSAGWENDLAARRSSGLGRYILEADIIKRNPVQVTDLLRDVPGLDVVPIGLSKIPMMKREGGQSVCFPAVFIDGLRQPRPQGDTLAVMLDLDLLVGPANVKAIEVYARQSRVPLQFLDRSENCGSLVIWTKAARE